MPWLLDSHALKRQRLLRCLERITVAQKTGLSEQSIYRHESEEKAPRTMQSSTVRAYATFYQCEPTAFAKWIPNESFATGVAESHHVELAPSDNRMRVLDGTTLNRLHHACRLFEGHRFLVIGKPSEPHELAPNSLQRVGGEVGSSLRCVIHRRDSRHSQLSVAVIATKPTDALELLAARDAGHSVTLTVVVHVHPAHENWPGFRSTSSRAPRTAFALLVDGVRRQAAATQP